MKIKKTLLIILFLIFSLFTTTSFGESTQINIYSPHCIVMEMSSGKVIYEKNGYDKVNPASTTKIMTAILTLENCELTDTATVSHNAIATVPASYSTAYLVEGEVLTINQLLHVLLLPSANDAANVLAEHIGGTLDSFATMMNTKAMEIGCTSTNFVNSNGITANNHYSTAYDLALIGRYAMQNEDFRKIVATTNYTLPATNMFPESTRFFRNTNQLLLPDNSDSVDNYYYPYTTGIKTGYTTAAGNCIVASAKKDDNEYIVVILGADETDNGLDQRYLDCKKLFDYAFDNYKTVKMHEAGSTLKKLNIANASFASKSLDVIVKDEINLVIKKDTKTSLIIPEVDISSDLVAPIAKNTVIGKITYNVDGNTYTSSLLAGSDVEEMDSVNTFLFIVGFIIILFFLRKLTNKKNKNKSKKKK